MKKKSNTIFLLENPPESVICTHARAVDSIHSISQYEGLEKTDTFPFYTVWVSREEDLHDFVYQVPDLAWEMLEYAEEPLEILYPQRKYISPLQESQQEPISIRLVRGSRLNAFVRKHGPLLTFTIQNSDDLPEWVNEKHDLHEKGQNYERVKSMKLFGDGSFTFVR